MTSFDSIQKQKLLIEVRSLPIRTMILHSAIYSIFQNTVIKAEKSNPLLIGLALGFSIKGFKTQLKSNLWFSYPDIRTMILHSAIYSIFQNTVIKADKSNPRGSVVIFNPRVKDSTKI